ncbi:ATP-dependent DNA helicase chl1 [Oleoguttula sp. CCFEE 5521]
MAPSKDFHHPYQPYEIQQQFMQAVYDCIEDGKVGIFESPTGTGKSLSLICGALTWLREHKRKTFDEALQSIQIDDDEPEWMLEHARSSKRREALQMRADLEERLAGVRVKERRTREHAANSTQTPKRRKQGDETIESDHESVERFALDDYESDQDGKGGERSIYSAATTDVLKKLGLLATEDGRARPAEMDEELKIFFCSRTHSQLSQFVGELQRVRLPPGLPADDPGAHEGRTAHEEVKQISLGSRKNLCINPKVIKLESQTAINERCMELQQSKTPLDKKCSFLPNKDNQDLVLDFRDHALASVHDIEDLAGVGKRLGVCPYYASRSAVDPAEIVTLPYPLMLQKSAREALGISLRGHVVIVDEAHNLMDAVESTYSAQITEAQLRFGREALMIYLQKFRNKLKGGNRVYVAQLVRVIDSLLLAITQVQAVSGEGGVLGASALLAGKAVDQINMSKLAKYISESRIARKVEGYAAHLKQADVVNGGVEKASGVSDTPTLTHVQNFLTTLANPSKEGRFFWTRDESDKSITLRYLLLNPSEHFRDIVAEARAVILAGGTMSPMEDYTAQLFPYLTSASISTLSCGHIIPASQLFVRSITSDASGLLNFTFKTRSDASLIRRLGALLLALLPKITGGTVIFFTSYAYLSQIQSQWSSDSTLTKLAALNRPFFFDARSTPAESTFASYSAAIHSNPSRGAVLFSVLGGKLSEGINFSGALGRCVIVVGLPFPNLETPEWKAKAEFLDRQPGAKPGAGRLHAENVCMRVVNQAVGRVVRHKGDWAGVVLVDGRFGQERILEKLPGWIRRSLPEGGGSGKVLSVAKGLGEFFEDRERQS